MTRVVAVRPAAASEMHLRRFCWASAEWFHHGASQNGFPTMVSRAMLMKSSAVWLTSTTVPFGSRIPMN